MAVSTSGTFNFLSITAEILIRDAFENIGLPSEFLDPSKYQAAMRSINLLMQEWNSKSFNLWTVQSGYLPLRQGQPAYALPNYVSDIVQMNTRTYTRQLDGLAASSSGDADNAFDSNPYTACTQDAPNGYIEYIYSEDGQTTQVITFIGITSFTTQSYTISVTGTLPNGLDPQTVILLTIPKQEYPAGVTQWFEVPIPANAFVMRITEAGGATLNIQELYFTNNTIDTQISNIAMYTYQNMPQKYQQSRPSCYYLQRNTNNLGSSPILYIWPVADSYWTLIQYTYQKMMQDVTYLAQGIDIPARFYPAMIWGLTWRLAMKYKPELAANFKAEYEESFRIATTEDSESVPITITISDGWGY